MTDKTEMTDTRHTPEAGGVKMTEAQRREYMAETVMRNNGNHYNMGRGNGWQELYRSDQEPRFTMLKGNVKARGGAFTEWRVDGVAGTLSDCLDRLQAPPVITPAELAALRDIVTDEPMRLRSDMFDHEVRYWLREKGLIEYTGTPGWFKRSDTARSAITAAQGGKS